MPIGLRNSFHEQLSDVDAQVRDLFTQVAVGVARTTDAFLAGDLTEAARFAQGDEIVTEVMTRVEAELEVVLARQSPMASDLRFMLTVLRIVPQLERSTELAGYIAERARLGGALPAEVRDAFRAIGALTVDMWEHAAEAWNTADPSAAARLDEEDDELDVCVEELPEVFISAQLDPLVGMECTLVGRFYERLGDHAVHICERIRWWANGS